MFGIVVYGFYFGTCIALAHAASEGARASVAGITAGERANFAEAQVRAIFARYAPLLSDDAAHLEIAAAPASEPGLFQVTVRYDLSDRNFSRLSGLFPLPSEQPEATRSEEHTSELQSLMRTSYAVFCLKKKQN